jgi:hypothetical protein
MRFLILLGIFVLATAVTGMIFLDHQWRADVERIKKSEPIDSMYYCHVDCIECKDTGRKQVNILNRKGQVIAIYYDTVINSKIPDNE